MATSDAKEASELEIIKKEVRSLLLTYPKGVNVRAFARTFREVCRDLPFQKYGFRSADGMLFAFTDVLNVRHTPEGVHLYAIPDEKSSHVQELVSKQKPTTGKNRKRYNARSPFRDKETKLNREMNPYAPLNEHVNTNFYPRFYPPFPPYPSVFLPPAYGPQLRFQHAPNHYAPAMPLIQNPPQQAMPLMWNGDYNFRIPPCRPLPRPPPGFSGPPAHQNQFFGGGAAAAATAARRDEGREHVKPVTAPPRPSPTPPSPAPRPSQPPGFERKETTPSPVVASGPPKIEEKAESRDTTDSSPSPPRQEKPDEQAAARGSVSLYSSDSDDDSDGGSSGSSTKASRLGRKSHSGISDKMIQNFRIILSDHPEGVTTSKFARLYKSKFNVPLDFEDYGFTSVREMVLHLPKVFVFEKTKSARDWTLFDARISPKKRVVKESWVPSDILDKLSDLTQDSPHGIKSDEVIQLFEKRYQIPLDIKLLGFKDTLTFLNSCKSVTVQEVDGNHIVLPKVWGRTLRESRGPKVPALPPDEELAEVWSSYFKVDECGPRFEYTQPQVPSERVLKVFLCDAYSPWLLWLHDVSRLEALNDMMNDLNKFYDDHEEDFVYPDEAVKVNFPCIVRFKKDYTWYRAKIEEIVDQKQVKVRYVDYGTLDIVGVDELRKLVKKYANDPIYAYTCKMTGIEPVGDEWPAETASFLFQYNSHPLFAEFVESPPPVDNVLPINLFDTTDKNNDVNIAGLLISRNLAKALKPRELDRFDEGILEATMMLLPFWITESDCMDPMKDLVFTAKNLISCTDPNFKPKPIDLELDPCCNEHDLLTFFRASPKCTLQLWATVLTKYRDQMTSDFLRMGYELSKSDWRDRQNVHGIRCPVRNERAARARERMTFCTQARKNSGIGGEQLSFGTKGEATSLSARTSGDTSRLSNGDISGVSLAPLANSSEIDLSSRSTAHQFKPPVVPEPTEDLQRLRLFDPYDTHAMQGVAPMSSPLPPPRQLPNAFTIPPHLNGTLPPVAPLQGVTFLSPPLPSPHTHQLPTLLTHPHLSSIPPSAASPVSPLVIPTSVNHIPNRSHSLGAPPPTTSADSPSSSHVNGYFGGLNSAPSSQGGIPPIRQRSESVASQSSTQRRCKCTTSIQIVDLADQIVHVIQHGDGLFLSCDELLKNYAANLSKAIITERLQSGQKYFKFAAVNVHADDHPKLFAELYSCGLVDGKIETVLFSVREVGNFFRTLLPNDTLLADLADEKFANKTY